MYAFFGRLALREHLDAFNSINSKPARVYSLKKIEIFRDLSYYERKWRTPWR